jgi:hypothetical protein
MHHPSRPGLRDRFARAIWVPAVLLAALAASGCSGSSTPSGPTGPPPTAVTETFDGTLTVNGAVTQPFVVGTAGTVQLQLAALEPADAVIGVGIGTWNGVSCQIVIANDNATSGASAIGNATATGNYCVRVYDAGKLTRSVGYQITVTHF